MATQLNPFHIGFDRGKHRTLAEIEAASKGSNTIRNQPARPLSVQGTRALPVQGISAKVSEWLSNQGIRLGSADFVDLNEPNNRDTPIIVNDDEEEPVSHQPRSQRATSRLSANTPRRAMPDPSSRHISNQLKRKASQRDGQEEDVIIVQAPPRTSTRGLWAAEVIDLTKRDRPKRMVSFYGNRDDDVIIIDPPAAEIRRDLRPLVLGKGNSKSSDLSIRPSKRRRQTLAEPRAQDREPSPQQNSEPDAPKENAVEASKETAAEASALIESVESITHFFTLATEIRDKIYRHLLVSSKPIQVQRLWTEPARRPTRRGTRNDPVAEVTIDTQILRACRRTALEGTRILYSENTFLYQLRDPEVLEHKGMSTRRTNRLTRSQKTQRTIDLAKFGHLIRHMAIELEPNRIGASYQDLMAAALDTLVSSPTGAASPRIAAPSRPPCGPIHLHTLTITISPVFESNRRTVRPSAAGDQDVTIKDGRFLSVVNYFSRGASVFKALQRINVNFLRINVHVNSNVKTRRSRADSPSSSSDDEESDSDEESSTRPKKLKPRHLETTLDLRYLPRHVEAIHGEECVGDPWKNDQLMQEKRRQQGIKAKAALASLRKNIEDACLKSEEELRHSVWEEHGNAERQRRERRARDEAKFDGDAYDDEGGDQARDGRGLRGMKSLIISIDRVGGELRVYRP